LDCTNDTFSDGCSKHCSIQCKMTDNGRNCARDTGACLFACKTITSYGAYCEKQCSDTCNNRSCDWKTGNWKK
jgi:hypothetical protein